jgi:hypothetical protein
MQTQATDTDSAFCKRLLERLDADDFSNNFTIVEESHGFSVYDTAMNGPTLGPYPTMQKAEAELEKQAALMKGLVRLYIFMNMED